MKLVSLSTAVLLAVAVSNASAQESSRDDFRAFCQAVEGRFVGKVTWVADWPGLGKKGDKVTAYFEGKMAEDGHALTGRWYAGDGSATGLYYYHAAEKRIKVVWVNSGGGVGQCIISRKGNQWSIEGSGCLADGTKTTSTSTLTITDDGNTHTYTGTGTVGGEKTDDQLDVYRRVNK